MDITRPATRSRFGQQHSKQLRGGHPVETVCRHVEWRYVVNKKQTVIKSKTHVPYDNNNLLQDHVLPPLARNKKIMLCLGDQKHSSVTTHKLPHAASRHPIVTCRPPILGVLRPRIQRTKKETEIKTTRKMKSAVPSVINADGSHLLQLARQA